MSFKKYKKKHILPVDASNGLRHYIL